MALASISGLFTSFIQGFRLIDGGDLLAMVQQLFSNKTGIVALAGGGQVGATPLPASFNQVDTCVTNSDSVMLPLALPGAQIAVLNATGQTLAVFGQPNNPATGVGDTIASHNSNVQQPTATGVTQATTLAADYQCYKLGQWKQNLSG